MVVAVWPINAALAAAPGEINFQGLLLDSGGMVVNGLVDLDFELFDAASAGTSLWSESQPNVSVLDGVYDVALGSIMPIGAAVLVGGSVWLEITVEGETLTPRQRLLAVPYALRAAEADHATTAGNLPTGTLEAIYANFPFDGAEPPNDDPSEGLADTDNDGLLNFIDPDNDNDGLSDSEEVAQGSNINLTTPDIVSVSPVIADDIFATPVTVTGTHFIAGQTVQVGPQTPTPMNITPTSFDFVLDAQPAPTSTTLIVTRPNAEQASFPFSFALTVPSITSLTPFYLPPGEAGTIDVVGTNFLGPLTVTVAGNPITPTSVTATSFSVAVPAQSEPSSLIAVTLSNGQTGSKVLAVHVDKTVFATSAVYTGDAIGGLTGGDAICAAHATAAGLPGTFLAWLGDSTGSPATRFAQSLLPYIRTDGVVVALTYADLTSSGPLVPISLDESQNSVIGEPGTPFVFTGVKTDGTAADDHCDDWTQFIGGTAIVGRFDGAGGWTFDVLKNCTTNHSIYCFEQ